MIRLITKMLTSAVFRSSEMSQKSNDHKNVPMQMLTSLIRAYLGFTCI